MRMTMMMMMMMMSMRMRMSMTMVMRRMRMMMMIMMRLIMLTMVMMMVMFGDYADVVVVNDDDDDGDDVDGHDQDQMATRHRRAVTVGAGDPSLHGRMDVTTPRYTVFSQSQRLLERPMFAAPHDPAGPSYKRKVQKVQLQKPAREDRGRLKYVGCQKEHGLQPHLSQDEA